MREDTSGVRGGSGRDMPASWTLRNSIPTNYWTRQYTIAPSVPSPRGNAGNNRPRTPSSWQARNRWYSRVWIGISIAALVALLVVGMIR